MATATKPADAEAVTAQHPASRLAQMTIHERLAAILAELPALGKGEYNKEQRFHFRSHDSVLNALNPLLGKYGVVVVPYVRDRKPENRMTSNNKTMYEVNVLVEYTFYGLKGDSVVAAAWGEGTDMGDKSTNKAMTMAFKNVLAQVFAVSTEETVDSDAVTVEDTTRSASQAAQGRAAPAAERKAEAPKLSVPDLFSELKLYTDEPDHFIREAVEKRHNLTYPERFTDLAPAVQKDTWYRMAAVVKLLSETVSLDDVATADPETLKGQISEAFSKIWEVKVDGPAEFAPPVPFG